MTERRGRPCAPRWTGATGCSGDPERTLLNRLAVFVRGWTLEGGAPLDLLTALIDQSLIVRDRHGDAMRSLSGAGAELLAGSLVPPLHVHRVRRIAGRQRQLTAQPTSESTGQGTRPRAYTLPEPSPSP